MLQLLSLIAWNVVDSWLWCWIWFRWGGPVFWCTVWCECRLYCTWDDLSVCLQTWLWRNWTPLPGSVFYDAMYSSVSIRFYKIPWFHRILISILWHLRSQSYNAWNFVHFFLVHPMFCCRCQWVWSVSTSMRWECWMLQHSWLLPVSLFPWLFWRWTHLYKYVQPWCVRCKFT